MTVDERSGVCGLETRLGVYQIKNRLKTRLEFYNMQLDSQPLLL